MTRRVVWPVTILTPLALSGCTGTGGDEAPRLGSSASTDGMGLGNQTVTPPPIPETRVETIDHAGQIATAVLLIRPTAAQNFALRTGDQT